MKKKYLEIGRVAGTHGIKGEIKVEPWCDDQQTLCKIKTLYLDDAGTKTVYINFARPHKTNVLLTVKGVNDVDAALPYRNKILYADRTDIPLENGYFIADLIGCSVFDQDEAKLGTLTDVLKTGANDVWQVSDGGRDYLIPVIPDVVLSVDIDTGKIIINPLKGIFDDD